MMFRIFACIVLSLNTAMAQADEPAAKRPNIIVIVADDLGYGELTCQGYTKDIPTPCIDAIAQQGVRFTNGYVTCPVCSPTRAGLLTGRYQQRFGHEFNPGPVGQASEKFGLPLTEALLPARLSKAGYVTGMVGKWHLGYQAEYTPTKRGFSEFFGFLGGAHAYLGGQANGRRDILRGTQPVKETEYLTTAFGREAVHFIEKHQKETFFLYLPFNAVHAPLQATGDFRELFPDIKNSKRLTFAAMLAAMDESIGKVMQKLRELKLEENTLVFFISDNGGPTRQTTSNNGPLRGYKTQVLEGGIRIPFMVQWKGHLPTGVVNEAPVISLDITTTALAAAQIQTQADDKFDGVNLLPYLNGTQTSMPHEHLYWRFGDQKAIRQGDWKLIYFQKQWKLYDLKNDIGEKTDRTTDKPEVVKSLRAAYDAWDQQLAKPLWKRSANSE